MMETVVHDPPAAFSGDGSKVGGWWHTSQGRVVCDLCPRACSLHEGQAGFCFVRRNEGGKLVLTTYGKSTGFCVDPVEKKPLNHFYPGTSVLSFGTAGCNLGCKFCQNWEISKSRQVLEILSRRADPGEIARAAALLGCEGVAFTYNDPVIWAEYAIDCASACRELGLKAIAVTAGYICPEPRAAFFRVMDAANVDLKGFTESFYAHYTLSHLQPVLDTLQWIKADGHTWLEITNLVIPGANDELADIERMCTWILDHLGPDVPLHFTAFHPDFRLRDRPPTPPATLAAARARAMALGMHYVYTGNVADVPGQSTYCPQCKQRLIERVGYDITRYDLCTGKCRYCQYPIAGFFREQPGSWGTRRMVVDPSSVVGRGAIGREGRA
ncbi:MAG: AmmeMemoRadiSam system radical SAM enzyme [Pirellulales bacterium]|nr:AmmeMemoRadiSam system radical SAM enzyme [Pirellulales bacterium]